jgi:CubicO group peptidase (beta-lactamase class C family)
VENLDPRPAVLASRSADEFIACLVESGLASAAAGLVTRRGRPIWSGAAGVVRRRGASATPETSFDLSSLTKPFVATLAVVLARSGELPLTARIGDFVPSARGRAARATLESLLRHRSGLVPWAPLESLCRRNSEVTARILESDLWQASGPVYSDLGYILWARLAELHLGVGLAELLRERVLRPLDLDAPRWRPGGSEGVAESRLDRTREAELAEAFGLALRRPPSPPALGVVQDGNARFLGGVAGHAGLFGDAASVAALAEEWLRPRRLLRRAEVAAALGAPAGEYALGWARRRVRGTAGAALSPRAFGHAGSTGTTVWADPERGLVFVLLAHRTSGIDWKPLRRAFHRLAAGPAAAPRRRP